MNINYAPTVITGVLTSLGEGCVFDGISIDGDNKESIRIGNVKREAIGGIRGLLFERVYLIIAKELPQDLSLSQSDDQDKAKEAQP